MNNINSDVVVERIKAVCSIKIRDNASLLKSAVFNVLSKDSCSFCESDVHEVNYELFIDWDDIVKEFCSLLGNIENDCTYFLFRFLFEDTDVDYVLDIYDYMLKNPSDRQAALFISNIKAMIFNIIYEILKNELEIRELAVEKDYVKYSRKTDEFVFVF